MIFQKVNPLQTVESGHGSHPSMQCTRVSGAGPEWRPSYGRVLSSVTTRTTHVDIFNGMIWKNYFVNDDFAFGLKHELSFLALPRLNREKLVCLLHLITA